MDAGMEDLRKRLQISGTKLEELNAFLMAPGNDAITAVLAVVAKSGRGERREACPTC
jgi:hypothetical protein